MTQETIADRRFSLVEVQAAARRFLTDALAEVHRVDVVRVAPSDRRGAAWEAVSVRTGIGGQGEPEVKIEPFGNIHREPSGEAVVEDVREPLVDVYEEDDHVLVLAEIPGVSKKDVKLDLSGDRLSIRAQRGEKRYHKDVELPAAFAEEKLHWECANGILKIRLER